MSVPFASVFKSLPSWNKAQESAKGLLEFIENSPTPYHATQNMVKRLKGCGFKELFLASSWEIRNGGKYVVSINNSCLISFVVGEKYGPGNGFSIIGTHTDSPCLKVKPNYQCTKHNYHSVGVETYGGGIWPSWFDRDLTVAGRVMIRNENGGVDQRLVHLKKPIMRIPHVAIHLDRQINEKFSPNLENHLHPVMATQVVTQFLSSLDDDQTGGNEEKETVSLLHGAIAHELGCTPSCLVELDLCAVDCHPPSLGGVNNEFIFAPRLDNLFNAYCAMEGFLESLQDGSNLQETCIRMIVAYDNEEVGSLSLQGAHTALFPDVLKKIISCFPNAEYSPTISNSFFLSADQAHALHPNYPEKHDGNHQVSLHQGIVVKYNSCQRYATTAFTASIVKLIAERCSVPCQNFVMRNDMACGTTIGPIVAALSGIRTADVGFPTLSMHSIREMCCTSSVTHAITYFTAYFRALSSILANSNSQL